MSTALNTIWDAGLEDCRPTGEDRSQPSAWATPINNAYGRTIQAIIEQGHLLLEAKKALGHGKFGEIFRQGLVPYSQKTAERFMSIAAHPMLGKFDDVVDFRSLPSAPYALAELATLDADTIKTAIKQEAITPDMTVNQVNRVVRTLRGAAHSPDDHEQVEDVDYDSVTSQDHRDEIDRQDREVLEAEEEEEQRLLMSLVETMFPSTETGLPSSASRLIGFLALAFGETVSTLMHRNAEAQNQTVRDLARQMTISIIYTEFGLSQPKVAEPFGHESSNISRIKDQVSNWEEYDPLAQILDGIRQIAQGMVEHDRLVGEASAPPGEANVA